MGVHIMAFQYGLKDRPTVANRAVEILVKMFNLADAWGWRPSGRMRWSQKIGQVAKVYSAD